MVVIQLNTRWCFNWLPKKLCFFQVSLFPKKVAFFSRAWSLEISRGRLARQAPAYGWGTQRGRQSTQGTVNAGSSKRRWLSRGGGHYRKQSSFKEADRNILFHTPTMTNVRLWTMVSHHKMGSNNNAWLSWSQKEKQYRHAWAVIPVFWLAG